MLAALLLVASFPLAGAANVCVVSDFKNNVTLAMESCCSKGGGQVVIPKGTITMKPFEFPCNDLELHLEAGAILMASDNKDDFKGPSQPRFIYAGAKKNLAITGPGTIDGAGSAWWSDSHYDTHPYLVYFYNVTHVTFTDFTLQNSAKLTLVPKPCYDVKIYNVTITNPYFSSSKNLDCIDPAGKDIHIKDCHLVCGDDNVAVKGPSSNVLVEDCYFGTGHGASIGSITDTVVTNVTFRNIQMNGTDNGCRIKTKSGYTGGSVSQIVFDKITMTNVKHPIVIDGAYSAVGGKQAPGDGAKISDVVFSNIKADTCRDKCNLLCASGNPCTGVVLDNIDLEPKHNAVCTNVQGKITEPIFPPTLETCFSGGVPTPPPAPSPPTTPTNPPTDVPCDVDACLDRCVAKYGGTIADSSYYCAKGCCTMKTGGVDDKQHYCKLKPSERFSKCETSCKGSSDEPDRVTQCLYGCDFWPH